MPSPSIQNLDHLSLVTSVCRELHIAEMVDAVIPKKAEHIVKVQIF